jgi:hypothetical protein
MKNRLVTLSISLYSAFLLTVLAGLSQPVFGQETYLSVKSGGGFTGSVTEYRLYSTGIVQKGKGLADISFTETASLSKRSTRKFFKRAASITFPSFQHPGNIYHALTYLTDGKTVTTTWGDASHVPPADIKKLYDDLSAKLKALKFTASN